MNDVDTDVPKIPELKNVGLIAVISSVVIVLLIILQHNLAFQKKSSVVIPAGGTYLGPTNTPTAPPDTQKVVHTPTEIAKPTETQQPDVSDTEDIFTTSGGKAAASDTALWITVKGNKYPYSFSFPKALRLETFPNDPYDIYAILWNNMPANQNVLIGVDNLSRTDELKTYINVSKRSYVENWWKQFGGLKGVASIREFTNSNGLKGYRAKYLDNSNQSPNEDVFFEVPDPNYVIHIASGILDTSIFDRLLDSVAWSDTTK